MSSKRKSPPTKLEGGCQPTTTTTATATNNNNNITTTTTTTDISHTNLANFNQKSSNLIDKDHTIAHIKHSGDNELFTKPLNTSDCDDDELNADSENNDHNNNDDDASDNCDSATANTLTAESFDGKWTRFHFSLLLPRHKRQT